MQYYNDKNIPNPQLYIELDRGLVTKASMSVHTKLGSI